MRHRRLTALRLSVDNFCGLVVGPLGGLLATVGFIWTTGANSACVLSIFPIAYIFLREQPAARGRASDVFNNAGQQLMTILRSRNLWMTLLFIALFYFSPGFSTLLFYRQTDEYISRSRSSEISACSAAFLEFSRQLATASLLNVSRFAPC